MALSDIVQSRKPRPARVVMHGREKVGKSSYAAGAPSPVFLSFDSHGLVEIDTPRIEIESYKQTLDVLRILRTEKHSYRTIVLDPINWMEEMIKDHVIKTDSNPNCTILTARGGWGKGVAEVARLFRGIFSELDELNQSGLNIVVLAHSKVAKIKDPELSEWDRHTPKLLEENTTALCEWADAILYCAEDIATKEEDGKVRAVTSGERVIFTRSTQRAAFLAGTRYVLPAKLPLRWSAWENALAQSEKLRAELSAILKTLPPDRKAAIEQRAREARDSDTFAKILKEAKQ